MKKLRWSIIGAGGIADRRAIPALLQNPDFELVAIMDKVPETAKRIGEKYHVPAFTDEDEMLSAVPCDCVYIGTPVFCHYEQAMVALKHKVHTFIEKPIAMTGDIGAQIVDAFKKENVQLTIGYMMKHHNLHQKAKDIVASDGVGRVSNLHARFMTWYPEIPGAWRQNKALGGGGAVMDLAVHALELAWEILEDEIVDVKAFMATNAFSYEVEDTATIIFRTRAGIIGNVDIAFSVPDNCAPSTFEIYGTKGSLVCTGTLAQTEGGTLSHNYGPQGEYLAIFEEKPTTRTTYEGEGGDMYLKQFLSFAECVRNGKTDYHYTDRAVAIQYLIDKIYS